MTATEKAAWVREASIAASPDSDFYIPLHREQRKAERRAARRDRRRRMFARGEDRRTNDRRKEQ